MTKHNVIEFKKPETFVDDPITDVLRTGARNLLAEFSTVRMRTAKVRSSFSSKTVLTMAFKLCECVQKRWQRLYGYRKLGEVIRGVKFINGIEETRNAA